LLDCVSNVLFTNTLGARAQDSRSRAQMVRVTGRHDVVVRGKSDDFGRRWQAREGKGESDGGSLQRFFLAHRRQDAGEARREHRLAGTGRTRHQHRMAACGSHLERALDAGLALRLTVAMRRAWVRQRTALLDAHRRELAALKEAHALELLAWLYRPLR
jgi:hypothetical protein